MEFLDKLINLKYDKKSRMSLLKALLIFYLIIANNYTKELYSGQLSDFIKSNRFMQHLIGFTTMVVIVINCANVTDVKLATIYSVVGYAWFILTTRLELDWSLIILGLLVFGYFYESSMDDKEQDAEADQSLEEDNVDEIKKNNMFHKKIVLLALLLVTIFGVMMYTNKKVNQYGDNFDENKFIFGTSRRYRLIK